MAMTREEFDAIIEMLTGMNSSGTLNTGDMSILRDVILGVMTDTYTPPDNTIDENEYEIKYAPSWHELKTGNVPQNEIRSQIADAIKKGMPAIEVKQLVKIKILGKDRAIINPHNFTYSQLEGIVDVMSREHFDVSEKINTARTEMAKDDVLTKAGLPGFYERYNPLETHPDKFAAIDRDYTQSIKEIVKNSSAAADLTSALASRSGPSAGTRAQAAGKRVTDLEGAYKSEMQRGLFEALARQMEAAGQTPLKDAIKQKALFVRASTIPKATKTSKKYKAVGSNVVEA